MEKSEERLTKWYETSHRYARSPEPLPQALEEFANEKTRKRQHADPERKKRPTKHKSGLQSPPPLGGGASSARFLVDVPEQNQIRKGVMRETYLSPQPVVEVQRMRGQQVLSAGDGGLGSSALARHAKRAPKQTGCRSSEGFVTLPKFKPQSYMVLPTREKKFEKLQLRGRADDQEPRTHRGSPLPEIVSSPLSEKRSKNNHSKVKVSKKNYF